MKHVDSYFAQVAEIARLIDRPAIEGLATDLAALRERGGRLFFPWRRRQRR